MRRLLLWCSGLVTVGCAEAHRPSAPADPVTADAGAVALAEPAAATQAALAGASFETLTVGNVTGFVAVPLGATAPRPIVVGVHGAEDHADWSCSEWAATLASYAWVVCPQGPPFRSGFVWSSAEQIYERSMTLVAEVKRRWPDWIADGPMIYGGWSQGAMLGPFVISSHPGTFDRAVLVEVGYTAMNGDAAIGALAKGGVRRAIVSCSSTPCRTLSQSMVAAAPKHGVTLTTNDVGLRGHWFDAPVFESLGGKWPALVDGDARWSGYQGR